MLKVIVPSILLAAISANAQIECPTKYEKVIEVSFAKCETPASYALPKYKYTSQSGEAIEYKKSLTVSGYVTAATGSPILLNSPRVLEGDLMFSAETEKNYSPVATEVYEYNGYKLRNAMVVRTFSSGAVVPSFHVPYLIPEAKIALLKTDGLNCEYVKGNILTEATCSIDRIDQRQYDCNCTYQILE